MVPTMNPFVDIISVALGSYPLLVNKSQDISSPEKDSVGNTRDAVEVSLEISYGKF